MRSVEHKCKVTIYVKVVFFFFLNITDVIYVDLLATANLQTSSLFRLLRHNMSI